MAEAGRRSTAQGEGDGLLPDSEPLGLAGRWGNEGRKAFGKNPLGTRANATPKPPHLKQNAHRLGREGAVCEATGIGTMPRTRMVATLWAGTGSRRTEGGEGDPVRLMGIGGDRDGLVRKEHLGEGGACVIIHRVIVP